MSPACPIDEPDGPEALRAAIAVALLGVLATWLGGSPAKGQEAGDASEAGPAIASGLTQPPDPLPQLDGYRGCWYMNQPSGDRYRYKYSGGMATYPQQHAPIAWYAPEVGRTFFCYGGARDDGKSILHMISYYDHEAGTVPRPRVLLDKETTDAHDNPVLAIDEAGHIWVFSNAHGTGRPAYLHRSKEPYDIDSFECVWETNFSYGQPQVVPGRGFFFFHTRYGEGGRRLFTMTSPDGIDWSEPKRLAFIEKGHYQISERRGTTVATAFNEHPEPVGLNRRTNLYYLESPDMGATWTAADGTEVEAPLTGRGGPALVHDYLSEGRLVYLKDLAFDTEGRPVLLYLTSDDYPSGPASGPRTWHVACWAGESWRIHDVAESDHNYDFGFLDLDDDPHTWRVLAATAPGAQAYGTGGDIQLWTSEDRGREWRLARNVTAVTEDAPLLRFGNANYPRRPVGAHPDFAALWADGDAFAPSDSALYFCDRDGMNVYQLPLRMDDGPARPLAVPAPRSQPAFGSR